MFKNLREKISVSDSNSKNKQIFNTNLNDTDNTSGEQNLSRFSSISSLVSDVGSAFSKALTNPQHVQPMTRNSKQFYDFDSVSEYDDSVVQGDIINKEELFQRYQRAQAHAKRYKTRSLEVTECYKQLELENMKLTQTLTDAQDCSIRRLGELREQIELDKKAKTDIEENYQLMLDEKVELINVLRLQISLLKEGKDLPIELESQIKEKHDLEIQRQKQKEDEIKELKTTMSQRENLLQRCKEKITSLNTQLMEIKSQNERVTNTSVEGDSDGERFSTELAKLSCQHAQSLENIQKEHSERIRNMLLEFDEQKSTLEAQLHSDYGTQLSTLRDELKESNERISRIVQDNERLQEQVNINANIIESLMAVQDQQNNPQRIIESSSYFELQSNTFNQEINMTNDAMPNEDLKDEIKFLLGKIEQMETLKRRTEEETTKTEEDLKNIEITLMKERDESEVRCNSYKKALEDMKLELESITAKCENLSSDVHNLNVVLTKKNEELEDALYNQRDSSERIAAFERDIKRVIDEKSNLLLQLDRVDKENIELEDQLLILRQEYENEKLKFRDQGESVKDLHDKCDELNSVVEKETHEKEKLLALLNGNEKITESPFNEHDGLILKIVEMRLVYDQQVEEGREQIHNMNIMLSEKNAQIHDLERKIEELTVELCQLKEVGTLKEEIQDKYNSVCKEFDDYRKNIESVDNDKEVLLKIITEEKEKTILKLNDENQRLNVLESKMKDLVIDLKSKENTIISITNDNSVLKEEVEQMKSQCTQYSNTKENAEKECLSKDEKLKKMTEEIEVAGISLSALQTEKDGLSNEISQLQIQLEELATENLAHKEKILTLEEHKVEYDELVGDFTLCKKEITIIQEKCDQVNERYAILLKEKDEVEVNNSSVISLLKDSLKTTDEKVTKSLEMIDCLNGTINMYKKYLNIFKSWIEDVISMPGNDSVRLDYWSKDLEEGCNADEDLALTGRSIDVFIKAWFDCQLQLYKLKEKICSEQGKNDFFESVRSLCSSIDDDVKLQTDEDVLQRLTLSRVEVERRDCQLIDLKRMLISDEFIEQEECNDESVIRELRTLIVNRITDLKTQIQEQGSSIKVLETEKEGFLKKFEKISNDRVQHFKVLTKIFDLTDIDFEEKHFIKAIMKSLKEYAKKSINMSGELVRLKNVDQQLKILNEESEIKDRKLEELRETISDDSSKLLVLRQELDKSISRLNDFADEKGRIDEEKQTLRKELHDLNNKIQDLKLDCERQVNDKMILEKHFDDSLEKVKQNHLALEENYRKEIEKHLGYQHYLEEQISTSRDETSRKMTENVQSANIKLEEVLKQSEELLVLNHQYKDLLERSKAETTDAMERLKQCEFNAKEVENETKILREREEELKKSSNNLTAAHEVVVRERDNLLIQLQELIEEKEKSVETLVHLQSSTNDVEVEKENYAMENRDLTARHYAKEQELEAVRELLEKSKAETTEVLERLKRSELNAKEVENEISVLREREQELTKSSDNLTAAHGVVIKERDNLLIQLQALLDEKERSIESMLHLQSSTKDVEVEKEKYAVENRDLTARHYAKEQELLTVRELLEKVNYDVDEMRKENSKLVKQLQDEQTNYFAIKNDLTERQLEVKSLRDKLDSKKSKLMKQKSEFEREIFEIKQQFNDEKSNINDDHNSKVKKLAKEFNDKMLTKEQEFQRTFHEALENIRNEDGRQKSDQKNEIESLNRMLIELEMEKNGLMDTISDREEEIKRSKLSLQTKESQLQSLLDDMTGYKNSITELQDQVSKIKSLEEAIEQRTKINQTVDTTSYFEDQTVETVNANDHDILQMHCADLEEQLRQLHQDNISLRQAISVSGKSHSPPSRSINTLTNQSSLDNGSMKNIGGSFRSPNTSCSEYQFCPYPITEATEYQYLRDILVKYMTGLETNTLARVVCTVMKFNRDETDRIVRFEQDKRKLLQIQIFS